MSFELSLRYITVSALFQRALCGYMTYSAVDDDDDFWDFGPVLGPDSDSSGFFGPGGPIFSPNGP